MSLNPSSYSISLNASENVTFGSAAGSPGFTDAAANTQFTNGSGAGQAQHAIYGKLTPGTGGTIYDLNIGTSAGNLPQGLDGAYRAYTGLRWLKIENIDANAGTITVQQGATNPFAGAGFIPANGSAKTLNPGDVFLLVWPTTAVTVDATHKLFILTGSGAGTVVALSVAGIGA